MGRVRNDRARRPSSNTAIASFVRDAEPGAWDQPQDCDEVAQADDGRGFENWAEGPSFTTLRWQSVPDSMPLTQRRFCRGPYRRPWVR